VKIDGKLKTMSFWIYKVTKMPMFEKKIKKTETASFFPHRGQVPNQGLEIAVGHANVAGTVGSPGNAAMALTEA
jgi:hypothetical protein